ncbi:MAG: branched-chain amino acid ABC transporter substrate-binding protein [Actinomycetota bacterium]|nr:branched-chain amino acid ABC transporter substrate-binding protein [Actinomycetota bacterium]
MASGGGSSSAASAGGSSGAASAGGSSGAASAGGSSSSGGGAATGLQIKPVVQIDTSGKEVKPDAGAKPVDPAGGGKAKCSGVKLAFAGALTGANAALGININDGAKVALDAHNKANPGCQVTMVPFDTTGDQQQATAVAPKIVADNSIIGLLGPAFSGETGATEKVFSQAGLTSLTASATNVKLTTSGFTTFFRGLANDGVQGPAVAKYMVDTLKYKKVCVIEDDSPYGTGLADSIKSGLGSVADASCAQDVKTKQKDFSAVVTGVQTAAPDAIFYSGYYAEAAPLVNQLRAAGVTAAFVSGDGTNDPQFVKQAGDAAKAAILSCPCGPAPEAFAKDYQTTNKQAPGVYSVEAYDLTTIMLSAIDSGVKDRAGMLAYVKKYDGDGLARHYKWTAQGELTSALIWIYKAQ